MGNFLLNRFSHDQFSLLIALNRYLWIVNNLSRFGSDYLIFILFYFIRYIVCDGNTISNIIQKREDTQASE